MVKIYIAASFPRRKEAQLLALRFLPIMEIVSTWHRDDLASVPRDGEECFHRVMRDVKQIRKSDLVIVFIGDNLTGGGRHTELGIAIGMGKNIILIGEYDSNPFELIPHLRVYESAEILVKEFMVSRGDIEAEYKWRAKQAKLNLQVETEEAGG